MLHSLFWLLDHYPETGESVASLHQAALEEAALADHLGFASLWISEHHFRSLSTVPNPAILLAAMAQHTRTIRLGPATSVLPLHNPIHLAEDYALVDVLSNGRLNMGVGSGSQAMEFSPFNVDFELRREQFVKNLASFRQRWEIAARGEFGPDSLNVTPIQSPAPPIYVATMNRDAAYEIGRVGDSLLTLASPSSANLEEVAARVQAHARGLEEAGKERGGVEAIVMMFAHASQTDAEVEAVVVPALSRLMFNMAGTRLKDPKAFYEEMRKKGIGVFGTPTGVSHHLERLADLGIGHVAFVSRFGGMSKEVATRSLRLLAPGRSALRDPAEVLAASMGP
ncbi:MAG: LLM class flavin-dependent oxidoreductase [Deltaproteobacteria bacterium]|nr:LLM class flavin-dependent oxidoreductase [Deltaproteobacteria bacterium]